MISGLRHSSSVSKSSGAAAAAGEVWSGAAAAASEVGRVHEGGEWEQLFDPFWAGCASGAIGGAFRVRPRAWRDRGGRFFADGLQVLLPFLCKACLSVSFIGASL